MISSLFSFFRTAGQPQLFQHGYIFPVAEEMGGLPVPWVPAHLPGDLEIFRGVAAEIEAGARRAWARSLGESRPIKPDPQPEDPAGAGVVLRDGRR